ncbi:MAG TPA: polynucleotide kinase, partial [Sulfitobacter sp.]|nr:polynucleotide kinase [Sulfitobacter sp.]
MTSAPLTPCVVFDVDGTLAEFDAAKLGHLVHGVEKQWDAFHMAMADAPLIAPIAKLMRRLKQSGETIVICSGRPDGWAEHTIA